MVSKLIVAVCLSTLACGSKSESSAESVGLRQDTVAAEVVDTSPIAGRVIPDSTPIQSWLLLRQAANTEDSAQRASLYVRVKLQVARNRIPWVEAQTLEKFNNLRGALAVYQTLEAPVSVLRLRYVLADSQLIADSVRAEMVSYIGSSPSASSTREAYQLFDKVAKSVQPSEELVIARAAFDIGDWSRAHAGFERLQKVESLITTEDKFKYATSLFRLRQFAAAANEYEKISSPRSAAAAARYQRARAFVQLGRITDSKAQLHAIEEAYPADSSVASALTLLADLASDEGKDEEARKLLRQLVQRFPSSRHARLAKLNIAYTSFALKEFKTATTAFSDILMGPDSVAARYWLGRARLAAGDTASARAEWQSVLKQDSLSYYGALAARRLNVRNMKPYSDDSVRYPTVPSVDSAMQRIELLRVLDMTPEITYENNQLFRDATSSSNKQRLLATAFAFAGGDQAGRAIALGRRALREYGPSAEVYRLIFPVAARDTIEEAARAAGIDPILVASLIRQESNFNPRAVSPVGARGLMQLMPNVATSLAKQRGISDWSTNMLFDPNTNITLGVAHLAPLIRRQVNIPRALAAYNAGESRVVRWAEKRGADDAEFFTERIPFAETRDYVKNILRNREFYRALYTW